MKVGIYCEFREGNTLGGRELVVAVLCQWFAQRGDTVEFIHHSPAMTAERLTLHFGLNLEGVALRYLPPRSASQLWKGRQAWEHSLSAPYGLFVNIVHDAPVFCHARRGILIVLFPFFRPFSLFANQREKGRIAERLRAALRQLLYRKDWSRRLCSYQSHISISEFARVWTEKRWRIRSQVLYPPVDAAASTTLPGEKQKRNLILSVGRFSVEGVLKRQLELMKVFRQMKLAGETDWSFVCAGGAGTSTGEQAFLEKVMWIGQGVGGEAIANVGRPELRALFSEAKIFWHAAGFGEQIESHPERSEHYGIATVEAMISGCVPVVINQGAQSEIIEHGISGFLWNTLDELRGYTVDLGQDELLRQKMANAAHKRACRFFSRERFEGEFAPIVQKLFS